jgi:hypothetical protein
MVKRAWGVKCNEASREAEITELYTKSRIFFFQEVRTMNRAEGNAMIARGLADLLVWWQCTARIGALRSLSQAADPGCRRAGADAVARRAVSGESVLRITDGGDAAPSHPSGQPEAGDSG